MKPKFHISPDGRVRACKARIRSCDFGEEDHFPSKKAAMQAAIERQLVEDARTPAETSDWDTELGVKYQALLSFMDDSARKGDKLSEGVQEQEIFYRNNKGLLTLDYNAAISYVRSRGYPEMVSAISHAADGTVIQQQKRSAR